MKELQLLQDICLELYGVSLADIRMEEFERLDAVLWAISTAQAVLNKREFVSQAAIEWQERMEVEPLFCSQQCFNFYTGNLGNEHYHISCPNCGKEHNLINKGHCDCEDCYSDSLKEELDELLRTVEVCRHCDNVYNKNKYCCCPKCCCDHTETQTSLVVCDTCNRVYSTEEDDKCPLCYNTPLYINCGRCMCKFDFKNGAFCPSCGYEELPF